MLTGRRYLLDLTLDQAVLCEEFANICRVVWNTGLEQRREYRRRGAWMNYVPQAAELADAKCEHAWLRAAPSHVLQQTLRDLDRACREHGAFKAGGGRRRDGPRRSGSRPAKLSHWHTPRDHSGAVAVPGE
ncbi:helix-turn-helix domain-containing protein [Streptomyces sp. NPDC005728]|uniref:helix-turn-helix domain-containing protein n=1 Tax=Streptomyces sp. NPDC005728 TaxID=3157054 RepID=UPI003410AF20